MTTKEIADRIIARIDDIAGSPGSVAPDPLGGPVSPEVLAAINEGQELFAFLTLCLETTATLTIPASTPFFSLRQNFPDYLCPLQVSIDNVRIRPVTLAQLDSLDDDWQNTADTPVRYLTLGFNLFGVTPQPIVDTAAQLKYAKSPQQIVGDDFPEIPEQNHQSLVKYGVYRVRLKEGAQSLERGARELDGFLDDAMALGNFVRARSRAARYDTTPFELALFDRSRLVEEMVAKAR